MLWAPTLCGRWVLYKSLYCGRWVLYKSLYCGRWVLYKSLYCGNGYYTNPFIVEDGCYTNPFIVEDGCYTNPFIVEDGCYTNPFIVEMGTIQIPLLWKMGAIQIPLLWKMGAIQIPLLWKMGATQIPFNVTIIILHLHTKRARLTARGAASTMSPGWGRHPFTTSLCLYMENTSSLSTTQGKRQDLEKQRMGVWCLLQMLSPIRSKRIKDSKDHLFIMTYATQRRRRSLKKGIFLKTFIVLSMS